uniref:Uncharacterized protein n=1 Tax=Chelonoidis abingdonii TaxID=106734 RepID=A0A8C0QPY3_CHEAB
FLKGRSGQKLDTWQPYPEYVPRRSGVIALSDFSSCWNCKGPWASGNKCLKLGSLGAFEDQACYFTPSCCEGELAKLMHRWRRAGFTQQNLSSDLFSV